MEIPAISYVFGDLGIMVQYSNRSIAFIPYGDYNLMPAIQIIADIHKTTRLRILESLPELWRGT